MITEFKKLDGVIEIEEQGKVAHWRVIWSVPGVTKFYKNWGPHPCEGSNAKFLANASTGCAQFIVAIKKV